MGDGFDCRQIKIARGERQVDDVQATETSSGLCCGRRVWSRLCRGWKEINQRKENRTNERLSAMNLTFVNECMNESIMFPSNHFLRHPRDDHELQQCCFPGDRSILFELSVRI